MRTNRAYTVREEYLRTIKRNKRIIKITQISLLIFLIILWEVLANVGIIDSFITSKPSEIIDTFFELISDSLFTHIGITCLETIIGFLLGTIVGTACGLSMFFLWKKFDKVMEKLVKQCIFAPENSDFECMEINMEIKSNKTKNNIQCWCNTYP